MPELTPDAFAALTANPRSRRDRDMKHKPFMVLVCIRDGSEQTFFDDGPWPKSPDGQDVQNWQALNPSGSRQHLLRQVRKLDEEGFPVWVAKVPGLGVWDKDTQRKVMIPTAQQVGKVRCSDGVTRTWTERSEQHLAARDAMAQETVRKRKAKEEEERKATGASEANIARALDAILTNAIAQKASQAMAEKKEKA